MTKHADEPGRQRIAPDRDPRVAGTIPVLRLDSARRADGTWRVIELGDGQVSDRPATTGASAFLKAILGGS